METTKSSLNLMPFSLSSLIIITVTSINDQKSRDWGHLEINKPLMASSLRKTLLVVREKGFKPKLIFACVIQINMKFSFEKIFSQC